MKIAFCFRQWAISTSTEIVHCLWALVLALTITAWGVGEVPAVKVDCADELSTEGLIADPVKLNNELARIIDGVRDACVEAGTCSNTQLRTILTEVIEQNGFHKHPSLWRRIFRLPRHVFIVGLSTLGGLGAAVLSYYLTPHDANNGLPMVIAGAIGIEVGALVYPLGAAFHRRLNPRLEQLSFYIWDPDDNDSWGNIQRAMNDKERLEASQIYNKAILNIPHLQTAGDYLMRYMNLTNPNWRKSPNTIFRDPSEAVVGFFSLLPELYDRLPDILSRLLADNPEPNSQSIERSRRLLSMAMEALGNEEPAPDRPTALINDLRDQAIAAAGKHYALAILHSHTFFRGLHFYHPNYIAELRSWMPDINHMDEETKIRLIVAVCDYMHRLKSDEIGPGINRRDLIRFAFGVMLRWVIEFKSEDWESEAAHSNDTPDSVNPLSPDAARITLDVVPSTSLQPNAGLGQ